MIFDSHKSILQHARHTARAEARSTAGLSSMQLVNWNRSLLDLITGLRHPSRSFSNAKHLLTGLMKRTFLTVPTHLCSNPLAFNFSLEQGWSPFVDLTAQLRKQPDIQLEETRYYQFFRRIQTPFMSDALAFHDPSLRKSLPAIPYGSFPWGTFDKRIQIDRTRFYDLSKRSRSMTNIWCEKNSRAEQALSDEFRKYRTMLTSFQQDGYRPLMSKSVYPRASVIIKQSGHLRFIIREGKHRMAVLSALGCSQVLIHLDFARFPPVFESDIENWAYVRSGLISADAARQILNLYFHLSGVERATAVGLQVSYRHA